MNLPAHISVVTSLSVALHSYMCYYYLLKKFYLRNMQRLRWLKSTYLLVHSVTNLRRFPPTIELMNCSSTYFFDVIFSNVYEMYFNPLKNKHKLVIKLNCRIYFHSKCFSLQKIWWHFKVCILKRFWSKTCFLLIQAYLGNTCFFQPT